MDKSESEENLHKKLASDQFDVIAEAITPKTLGDCSTNTLLKAFEVSGYLRYQALQDRPDVEELKKLANSVEEFTTCLIDPLKSDTRGREGFGDSLDLILDKAIEYNQGKFLSHPVVYNLLEKVWRGRFAGLRLRSTWKWRLLKLFSLLDIVLFPFMFAILFFTHSINTWRRRSKATELCFILNATGERGKNDFKKMIDCIRYMVRKIGVRSANYCLISSKEGKAFQHIRFDGNGSFQNGVEHLLGKLDALAQNPSVNSKPALHDDFDQALEAFKNQATLREKSKKVIILFTNDRTGSYGPQKGRMLLKTKNLTETGARIVTVAVGERPRMEELEPISSDKQIIRCPLENLAKLGKMLLREVYEEDLYDQYLDYFTTPYFIFFRDSLSYLCLLGLHVAICLSPSVVSFSGVEWVISIFFAGRFLSEFKEYENKKTKKKRKNTRHSSKHRKYVYQQSLDLDSPIEVDDFLTEMSFSTIGKYFIDRWNVLDFIMLVIFVVTFLLRMITWGVSTSVTGNRALVIAGYCYGLNTMILTLRVFGHLMEASKVTGTTHIALMSIIEDVATIFFQFLVGILAFSLAMSKIYLAEGSFFSSEEKPDGKGDNMQCGSSGIHCWWVIIKHLCWTLLGVTDLEQFNAGKETTSDYLAQTLYAVFIIFALILLVNMMIAVLSSTYERVQNNSLKEWSFKRAVTIRTYRDNHPIPVPLNLVSQLVLALRRGSKYEDEVDNEILEKKEEALDSITKKLKRIYFAKYGFTFPLSGESKVNTMLSETYRNREMCNQIVRQVFPNPNHTDHRPVGRSAWQSEGIHIEDNLLTYVGPKNCSSCRLSPKEFHGARYKEPFSADFPKFEVVVQEGGTEREVVVGVVRGKHNSHRVAGDVRHTVGYHACNGLIVHHDASGKQTVQGPVVYRGDSIGCRAGVDEILDGKIPIFFSLNGQPEVQILLELGSDELDLYPFVGMERGGIRVLAKMCPGEVKYSERPQESMKRIERTIESQNKRIERMESTLSEILNIVKVNKEKQ